MEDKKKTSNFYSGTFGERRKKRHQKGQTRMYVLLAVLVLLLLIWLFLPNPAGTSSDPAERTRTFPAQEGAGNPSGADLSTEAASALPEDIAPNPLLEPYIDQELRESPYRFDITYPDKEAQLAKQADGAYLFRLAGRLYAAEDDEDEALSRAFVAHFFSNKPEDYEQFRPIFSEELTFQIEGDHYVFQLSHPEVLTPGLYYYLIQDKEEGEVFAVGKVSVVDSPK